MSTNRLRIGVGSMRRGRGLLAAAATLGSGMLVWALLVGAAGADQSVIVDDDFVRIVAGGLGSAPTGGAYAITGAASAFSVSANGAEVALTGASQTREGTLSEISSLHVDGEAMVWIGKIPEGGDVRAWVAARRSSSGADGLRAYLRVAPGGWAFVGISRIVGGTETVLDEVAYGAVTSTTYLKLRVLVDGSSPTAVRAKLWAIMDGEPLGWQVSVSESSASLQAAGSVGLGAASASGLSNATTASPVAMQFDNFEVRDGRDVTAPGLAYVYGGTSSWQNTPRTVGAYGASDAGGAGVLGYESRTSSDAGATWTAPLEGDTRLVSDPGETRVQYRAVDRVGNVGAWAPTAGAPVRIDATAPSEPVVAGGSAAWANLASRVVSASGATDAGGSGLESPPTQWRSSTDGGATWNSPASATSRTISSEGETLVQFRSEDRAGNLSAWVPASAPSGTVRLDRTAPSLATVSGGSPAWQTAASVTVVGAGATDAGGSGIDRYEHRSSTDAAATWSAAASGAALSVTQDGETLVQFRVRDGAGNTSAWAPSTGSSGTVRIDRTPPSLPSLAGGSSDWLSQATGTISASGSTDAGSGGVSYESRSSIDAGQAWSAAEAGASRTVSAEGETLVQFRVLDAVANTSSWTPAATIRLDRSLPSLPLVSGGATAWQDVEELTISATGGADTGGSGLAGYESRISVDGGTTWSGTASGAQRVIVDEGETLVQFRSRDGAGNRSAWTPTPPDADATVRIDRDLPPDPIVTGGSISWQAVSSIEFTSDAGGADIDHHEHRSSINAGASWSPTTVGEALVITGEGETLVQFRSVNTLGRKSYWSPATPTPAATARIDRTAPTSLTVAGGSDAWTNSDVTMTASGADDAGRSGLNHYEHRSSSDAGATWTSEQPGATVIATADGETLAQFRAIDNVGNTSAWTPTPPSPSASARIETQTPTTPTLSGGSATWTNATSVVVSATGSTDSGGSGLNGYQHRSSSDGSTWSAPAAGSSIEVTAEGETQLQFRGVDHAGNTSAWTPLSDDGLVRIDRTASAAPMVTSSTHPDPELAYENTTVTAAWAEPADASGIAGYGVILNEQLTTEPAAITQTATTTTQTDVAAGQHYLHVRARDAAGNWGATQTFGLIVGDPLVSIESPAEGFSTSGNSILQARVVGAPTATVAFEYRIDDGFEWVPIPATRVELEAGGSIAPPYPLGPARTTARLRWNLLETSSTDPGVGPNGIDGYEGPVAIRAVATTLLGTSVASDPIVTVTDTIPPTSPRLRPPASSAGTYAVGETVTVSLSSEPNQGLAGYAIAVDSDPGGEAPASANALATTASWPVTASSAEDRFLHVVAIDEAGNRSDQVVQRVSFADIAVAPLDSTTLTGQPLQLQALTHPTGAYRICWQYSLPVQDWRTIPAANVTIGGNPVSSWPHLIGAGTQPQFSWQDYGNAPGVGNWPGRISLRALLLEEAATSCDEAVADSSEVQLMHQPSQETSTGAGVQAPESEALLAPDEMEGDEELPTVLRNGTILYGRKSEDEYGADLTLAGSDGDDRAVIAYGDGPASASKYGFTIAHADAVGIDGEACVPSSIHIERGEDWIYPTPGKVTTLAVSPDGLHLAYSWMPVTYVDYECVPSGLETLVLLPLVGVGPERTIDADGAGNPFWTPDSDHLLWTKSGSVKTVPRESEPGTAPRIIHQNATGKAAWSYSGTKLAIDTADGMLIITMPSSISTMARLDLVATGGGDRAVGTNHPVGPWAPDDTHMLTVGQEDVIEPRTGLPGSRPTLVVLDTVSGQERVVLLSTLDPWNPLATVSAFSWTAAPPDERLAEVYRPIIWFDQTEQWAPISPNRLLSESDGTTAAHRLCYIYSRPYAVSARFGIVKNGTAYTTDDCNVPALGAPEDIDQKARALDPGLEGATGAPTGWTYARRGALLMNGSKSSERKGYHAPGVDCDNDEWCDPNDSTSVIYFHKTENSTEIYLQYWMFFRYDSIKYVPIWPSAQCIVYCGWHQGDWESVTVVLSNGAYRRPLRIHYSQHKAIRSYGTDDLMTHDSPMHGGHPIVYVASGTHALYPYPCADECPNPDVWDIPMVGEEAPHDGATGWVHNGNVRMNPAAGCAACVEEIDDQAFNLQWSIRWGWGGTEHGAPPNTLGEAPLSPSGQGDRFDHPETLKERGSWP